MPDALIPIATNIVIMMEMVGAWFLFSSHRILQRTALCFFIFFHLYSGILVEFRYPSNILPMLLIVFGPWYRYQVWPRNTVSIIPWVFMVSLLLLQLSPRMIEGDEKMTLEGNKYGLYMFEANHQCIGHYEYRYPNGDVYNHVEAKPVARDRCNPYRRWFDINRRCERNPGLEISWVFNHSINGGPFVRIVEEENMCGLDYHPFAHNEWIKIERDNPEVIGYPVKNIYH